MLKCTIGARPFRAKRLRIFGGRNSSLDLVSASAGFVRCIWMQCNLMIEVVGKLVISSSLLLRLCSSTNWPTSKVISLIIGLVVTVSRSASLASASCAARFEKFGRINK